jgi:hypothetical protein
MVAGGAFQGVLATIASTDQVMTQLILFSPKMVESHKVPLQEDRGGGALQGVLAIIPSTDQVITLCCAHMALNSVVPSI